MSVDSSKVTSLVNAIVGKINALISTHNSSGSAHSNLIVDNLTSTNSSKALSAKQGKELKDLIGSAISYINQ